jgi:glycosyltransferase involved in cell wall biosynthesis
MPAVIAALLSSPLADRYAMEALPTYRDGRQVRRLLLFAGAVVRLVGWCLRGGRRIVHVHVAARGSLYRKTVVVAVAKALRRPVILHVHAGPGDLQQFAGRIGPARRAAFRAAFRLADRVVSVSAASARSLHELFTDAEIAVIPNPPPPPPAGGVRARGGDGAVELLYLGGFDDPAKGGAVMVAALPELLERCPEARVVLAGPGSPPDALPPRAEWRGWLDDAAKAEALQRAEAFLLPSISEGLPVALLEAMSYGLPIVASRVGGIPEILTDGADALLIAPGDPGALADAARALVEAPETRAALGREAAERARRLGSDDVYRRLDLLYEELAG